MPDQQPFVGKGDEEWARRLLPFTGPNLRRRVAEALAAQREHCAKVADHYGAERVAVDIRAQSGRP